MAILSHSQPNRETKMYDTYPTGRKPVSAQDSWLEYGPKGCLDNKCVVKIDTSPYLKMFKITHENRTTGVITYKELPLRLLSDATYDLWSNDVKPWILSLHNEFSGLEMNG